MMKIRTLLATVLVAFLASCTAQKNNELDYLANRDKVLNGLQMQSVVRTLKPGDRIAIVVSAQDNDVVRPFNQNYSSSATISDQQPAGNLTRENYSPTQPLYTIDEAGDIHFPVLGNLPAAGKSLDELRTDLESELRRYVKFPTVNLRLTNFRVSVLGEVARPGEYQIEGSNPNLLSALALSGDLTANGRRDNIVIVRNNNGVVSQGEVNLQDASFFGSPYYQLQQGDIVYVSPNQNKNIQARTNPNLGIYISVASVALTALALTINLLKK